jgi:hypothetical protein
MAAQDLVAITFEHIVNVNHVIDITESGVGHAVITLSTPSGTTDLTVTGYSALEVFKRLQLPPEVLVSPRVSL